MMMVVTGATGSQGGAVVRALRGAGLPVRVLVRDPASDAARELAALGADLALGSFGDAASLDSAMAGAASVFSVQPAPFADPDSERDQARALIGAARRAGVDHFIHSSVSNTGDFRTMPGWAEGRWARNYWESKADVEAMVRDAGFPVHSILRPAFMMENFALPKAAWMFPDLAQGRIMTAIAPETRIALIAAGDIGAAVVAVLAEPNAFGGQPLEMAGDWLSPPEIAVILARVTGRGVVASTLDAATLIERGQNPGWVETQIWMNSVGYPARPAMMGAVGLVPTCFAAWAQSAAATIPVAG
ncbi:hypothetical protein GCM10011494_21740 [Novosphingobium endophyticum]|uniref:NmrA-like domain-containing protein n=1 Tax=Novosphingobium endophyticum TaxID=1955250 RepID=A0A916TTV6_9SPHN|nr:NmrA family NAD(P)-binding protein [Novosphingobium endophyticum]GGC02885.1 hypothetical protein GCM10011494_21740 [Novosphingobium endophyticum]